MSHDKRSIRTEAQGDAFVQLQNGADAGTDKARVNTDKTVDTRSRLYMGAPGDSGEEYVDEGNPLPVKVVEGTATAPQAEQKSSAALAAQASETLAFAAIPNLKTGRLQKVTASSDNPFKVVVEKFDGTTATTIAILRGEAGATVTYEPKNPDAALHEQASTGTAKFRAVVTNNNTSLIGSSSAIDVTAEWDEVTT